MVASSAGEQASREGAGFFRPGGSLQITGNMLRENAIDRRVQTIRTSKAVSVTGLQIVYCLAGEDRTKSRDVC